eukprot:scaffold128502_cov17-Tisochrysis_lutea.AAC.1
MLLCVVERLLQQQTAAHVRAALSILGHVQFSSSMSSSSTAAADDGVRSDVFPGSGCPYAGAAVRPQ